MRRRISYLSRGVDRPGFCIGGFEPLEPRCLLAAVAWDGGGDGINWDDPINWSTDVLPTASDAVSIGGSFGAVIHRGGGDQIESLACSRELRLTGGSLTCGSLAATLLSVEGGSLSVAGPFTITTSLTYAGGSLSGAPEVALGGLYLLGGESPVTFIASRDVGLRGEIKPGQEIWVRGSDLRQHARLIVEQDVVNAGTIRLESTDGPWSSSLYVLAGRTLTNAPSGVITAMAGSPGPCEASGTVINQGEISALAGARLLFGSGDFTVNGGRQLGEVVFRNTGIRVTAEPLFPVSLILEGGNGLLSDVPPNLTLRVRGTPTSLHAALVVQTSAVNFGWIVLESTDAHWGAELAVPAQHSLVNGPGGVIYAAAGGPRGVAGSFTNAGLVELGPGVTFEVRGDLAQVAGGELVLQAAGAAAGAYARLDALSVHAGGTLTVRPVDGYRPECGDRLEVAQWRALSGAFDLSRPSEAGHAFAGLYSTTSLSLLYTSLADVLPDGIVDFGDYLEFLSRYDSGDRAVDLNADGLVDFADYLEFLNLYEIGC